VVGEGVCDDNALLSGFEKCEDWVGEVEVLGLGTLGIFDWGGFFARVGKEVLFHRLCDDGVNEVNVEGARFILRIVEKHQREARRTEDEVLD
jgi:hypothetical protein